MVGRCRSGADTEREKVMGLMDEMMKERFGPPLKCPIHKVSLVLKGKDSAEFLQAVNDDIIPATVISKVLDGRGIKLTAPSIQKHRRKDCGCRK